MLHNALHNALHSLAPKSVSRACSALVDRLSMQCECDINSNLCRISRNIQYPVLTYVSQMLLNFRSRAQGYLMSFPHLNVSTPLSPHIHARIDAGRMLRSKADGRDKPSKDIPTFDLTIVERESGKYIVKHGLKPSMG